MSGWLIRLAEWCRLPIRSGFAELDLQIGKIRALRDSYQTSLQEQDYYQTEVVKKSGELLCRT